MRVVWVLVAAVWVLRGEGQAVWNPGESWAEPTVCDDTSCRCDAFSRILCNCTNDYDEVTIRPVGPYRILSTATAIIIDGCARVYFFPDCVNGTINLRAIELYNVKHVDFKENSILWSPYTREHELSNPGLKIIIDNSTIDNIASHTFKGRIDDIVIRHSNIRSIKPFAFSSLTGVKNIELTSNVYENIDIQTFKKFSTLNFVLRGGHIKTIPSRFLSDVEVIDSFQMNGVTIETVSSMAFFMSHPKTMTIQNNIIQVLEGDAFHASTRGPVTFRNNTVKEIRKGAFFGISVDRSVVNTFGLQELLVDNNTVSEVRPDSFLHNQTSVTLRIDGLNLAQNCECAQADVWISMIEAQGGTITCYYTLDQHYMSLPTYVDTRCGNFKENFWIFILVGLILAVVVAVAIVFIVVRRENEKKKKLQIVMPDGKTYRETELHVILERAELLTTDL